MEVFGGHPLILWLFGRLENVGVECFRKIHTMIEVVWIFNLIKYLDIDKSNVLPPYLLPYW